MKIKNKLTFFFLIIGVLPLIILGFFSVFISQRALFRQAERYLDGSVSIISDLLNEKEAFINQALKSISNDSATYAFLSGNQGKSSAEKLELEQNLQKNLINIRTQNRGIKAIFVVSEKGHFLVSGVSTSFERSHFQYNFIDGDFYKSIKEGQVTTILKVGYEDRYDRLYYVKRLQNFITGEYLGVLIFSIDERTISEVLEKVIGDTGGEIYYLNDDRIIISSIPATKLGTKLQILPEGIRFTSVGGVRFINEEFQIGKGNSIHVKIPVKSLLSGTQYISGTIIFFASILSVLAFIFSILITNHFTNPIFTLMEAMKTTETGDFEPVNEVRNDEFSRLFEGYNGMVIRLSKSFDALNSSLDEIANNKREIEKNNLHLEELVRERTKELLESEKMASLGNLVASVAHEINTPIGIAVTAVSYMDDGIIDLRSKIADNSFNKNYLISFIEKAEEATKLSMNNLKKAANLVVSFKRVAVDQSNEQYCRFNMLGNIEDIVISLKPKLTQRAQVVNVICPPNLSIVSYPGVYYQIISNFINNSLMHGYDDNLVEGIMQLSVIVNDEYMIIKYSDDGKGIDPENLPKVFEPFFTTKRNNGGTGLGMHIVYNLVTQKLKGKIECLSTPGKGTTFNIYIPREECSPVFGTVL